MFTGGGIILLEHYNNSAERTSELVAILFGNRLRDDTLYVEEGGGKKEKWETVDQTARRELREESRNLFHAKETSLDTYVDVNKYRAYIILLKSPIDLQYYKFNKDIIDMAINSHEHREWMETNFIFRVSLNQMLEDGLTNNNKYLVTKDIDRVDIVLRDRTKAVLKKAYLENKLKMSKSLAVDPILEYNYKSSSHHKDFLEGTKYYYF